MLDRVTRTDAAIRDRIAGATWREVADRHGYANAASARSACRGWIERRGRDPRILNRYPLSPRAREALKVRLAGASWREVAARFGYSGECSARGSVLCVCADDGERERARIAWVRPLSTRRRVTSHGYIAIAVGRDHPLAYRDGWALEHRVVLVDVYGFGPLPCFDCGRPIAWADLEVHHRDHDRANNTPENLAPACGECNTGEMLARRRAQEEEWGF